MSLGKSRTVGLCSFANFINAADRAIMPSRKHISIINSIKN